MEQINDKDVVMDASEFDWMAGKLRMYFHKQKNKRQLAALTVLADAYEECASILYGEDYE